MNKKFYFALALTAGLFASCSSDDVVQAPGLDSQLSNQEGAINLSILNGSQGITRGTGTVGSTDATAQQWAGQKVNVYMLKTGTLNQAYEVKDDGTDDTANPLYANQEMVVEAGNAALILDIQPTTAGAGTPAVNDRIVTSKYFPGSGVYDFWGYRTDGAETSAPVGVNDATATQATIAFEIDGSQDLMSGKAVISEDAPAGAAKSADGKTVTGVTVANIGQKLSTGEIVGTYGGNFVPVDPAKVYSAYAARRGIDPVLHFTHRLARFTFQVKGANADCCILDGETDVDKIAAAVNVTGITVKDSKYKGDLVIAYTGTTEPEAITWDGTVTKDLALKQRVKKVTTAAVGDFYGIKVVRGADDAVTGDPTYSYTVSTAVAPAAPSVAGASMVNGLAITDAMEVYDAYATNAATTNLPNGNKTTIADIKTALTAANTESAVYYRYFNTTPVVYSTDPADIDLTADLVDLDPVQPIKSAAGDPQKTNVGEAMLLPAGVNQYIIELALQQTVKDQAFTRLDANGKAIYVDDVTTPTVYYLYSPAQAAVAADLAATVSYANAGDYATAKGAASESVATTQAAAEADAATQAAGTYFYVNDATTPTAWWSITVNTAAVPAVTAHYYDQANAATHMTNAGQQIAVATVEGTPATYKKWVTSTTIVKNMTVKQPVKLPNDPSTGTPMAFTAGKSYNVVITVNGLEEIGGDGTTGPVVDAYVDYGTDIDVDDNTQLP